MTPDLQKEERYSLAIDATGDGLWDWDLKNNTVFYSDQWKSMLGYNDPSTIGDSPQEWFSRLHPDDQAKFQFALERYFQGSSTYFKSEYRIFHEQGHYLWVACRGRAVWDKEGRPIRFIGLHTDITMAKQKEDQLFCNAFHDPLTGLSNRALFMDHLAQAFNSRNTLAILYMDMDLFKRINDTLGHRAGDELLSITARRLESCSRKGDTIARLGGDEFALLLPNVINEPEVKTIAKRIAKEVSLPFIFEDKKFHINISIGIAIGSSSTYKYPKDLLRDADIALYEAKDKKRGKYQIFNKKMRRTASAYLRLETELKRDLERGKIIFYYQPIIDVKRGEVAGFEALLRWEHKQYGVLNPAQFLSIAEETQLIVKLEKNALKLFSEHLSILQQYIKSRKFFIEFNISSQRLREKNCIKNLRNILNLPVINPPSIHIDVSESIIINNIDHIEEIFKNIKECNFKLSFDGFGTSYSSLTYLHRYPFDFLKIDHSCITEINNNTKKLKLVKNIINLGKSLNIKVIAEGIESENIFKILQKLHCPYAQGFYFSQPLPIEKIVDLLCSTSSKRI